MGVVARRPGNLLSFDLISSHGKNRYSLLQAVVPFDFDALLYYNQLFTAIRSSCLAQVSLRA